MPKEHITASRAVGCLNESVAGSRSYADLWCAERVERIRIIEAGLPIRFVAQIAADMGMPPEQLSAWLRLSPKPGGYGWKSNRKLTPADSERALGLARLVGQVESLVTRCGDPSGFNAPKWVAGWLTQPNPALGGRAPSELVKLSDGRETLSTLIARMESNAYS